MKLLVFCAFLAFTFAEISGDFDDSFSLDNNLFNDLDLFGNENFDEFDLQDDIEIDDEMNDDDYAESLFTEFDDDELLNYNEEYDDELYLDEDDDIEFEEDYEEDDDGDDDDDEFELMQSWSKEVMQKPNPMDVIYKTEDLLATFANHPYHGINQPA
ncbi:Uncharacterized protein QTN25_005413 [Entamoeba marina]